LILAGDHGIGFEDVSGAPWIEIDFPDDIRRATTDILPALEHA
jgi:choline kinase